MCFCCHAKPAAEFVSFSLPSGSNQINLKLIIHLKVMCRVKMEEMSSCCITDVTFLKTNEQTNKKNNKVRDHQDSSQILNLGLHRHRGNLHHRHHHHHPPDLILDRQSRSVWTGRSDVHGASGEELAEVKSREGAVTLCV